MTPKKGEDVSLNPSFLKLSFLFSLLLIFNQRPQSFFHSGTLLIACVCVADKLLAPPAADSDGESDGSDRVPVPSFQNSFSQAIEKALLQLDSEAASVPPPIVEPGLTTSVLSNRELTGSRSRYVSVSSSSDSSNH